MPEQGEEGLTDISRYIPEALKRLRLAAGLRQTHISEASGLTKAMLSAYERGNALPTIPSLWAYLAALGRDLTDLQDELNYLAGLPKRRSEDVEGRERAVGRVVLRALRGLSLTEENGPMQEGRVNRGEPSTQPRQVNNERRPEVVFVLLTESAAGYRSETLPRIEEPAKNG